MSMKVALKETPFFFLNGAYQLFGILHEPVRPDHSRDGVVLCAPFGEEKLIAHRVLVNMARSLAAVGHAVLRFDFMGEGDSGGGFEDSTIASRLSDISAALSMLKEKTGSKKVGLLGARFGATLALLAAARNGVDSLVLIAPIISGKQYMEQCLRSNLTTQMAAFGKITKDRAQLVADLLEGQPVNVDGYLISKALYQEMIDIDLLRSPFTHQCRTLLVNLAKHGKQTADPGLGKLHELAKESSPETSLVSVPEEPFWKDTKRYLPDRRYLQKAIADWYSGRPAS